MRAVRGGLHTFKERYVSDEVLRVEESQQGSKLMFNNRKNRQEDRQA